MLLLQPTLRELNKFGQILPQRSIYFILSQCAASNCTGHCEFGVARIIHRIQIAGYAMMELMNALVEGENADLAFPPAFELQLEFANSRAQFPLMSKTG